MIEQIFIKNFKAFEKETIQVDYHNILIGENDSGKSTILQALEIFFNQEKIDKCFVRDTTQPVEIGVLVNKKFYKKTYSPASYKISSSSENITDLDIFKYIYIPVSMTDSKQLVTQLSAAKVIEKTSKKMLDDLKKISQASIDEVINGIDEDLLIIDHNITKLIGEESFKYDAALKFNVTSNGIPIESRGSGFQKNLIYALLVGNKYSNVIVGIDEIENSFSVNNCMEMLDELQSKIAQTFMSTHSKKILEVSSNSNIIPLFSKNCKTLSELMDALDKSDTKKFILVEGKFDLPWYKKCVELLGKSSEYIILPGGGENNADNLCNELTKLGKKCIVIKDGDTKCDNSISKDCIELYTPLESINKIFKLDLKSVPLTKKDFFNATTSCELNDDSIKGILAKEASNFLKSDNELIGEVGKILKND